MRKSAVFGVLMVLAAVLMATGCNKPSRVEQYRAEKHQMDSVRLAEQVRSLAFYETQLDSLLPVSDSLIALFQYERNEQYQDHGFYVVTCRDGVRILVRDDGHDLLVYKAGQRIANEHIGILTGERDQDLLDRAEHLQIVIRDIKELEHRISKTNLEIQKYEKRLQTSKNL